MGYYHKWLLKAALHTEQVWCIRQRAFFKESAGAARIYKYHTQCKKRVNLAVKSFLEHWIPSSILFLMVYSVFTLLMGELGEHFFPYGLAVILILFLLKIIDIILLPIGLWTGLRK